MERRREASDEADVAPADEDEPHADGEPPADEPPSSADASAHGASGGARHPPPTAVGDHDATRAAKCDAGTSPATAA